MFISSLAACTNDDVISEPIFQSGSKLNLTVDVNPPQSRGILEGNALADGSEIGILLDDGASTEYDAVDNIKFTAVREDGSQKWQPETDIVLSGTTGTLYAYYPYKSNTDLSAIPVETTSQTDYLYATPVSNVNESNASVAVTMNHMLSNIKVSIARGTYVGVGNITNITIQSDGFATGGTFNAAQATPGFTTVTGVNEDITQAVNTTLGGTAANIMVVPTGTSKAVTFIATIDDVDYTATSTDVELEEGNSYEYTLSLNSTFMSVASVAVTPWNTVPKESLTLEKYISWENLENGVYAVSADGSPVSYEDANESCIAVALIVTDAPTPQRLMIEKYEASNTSYATANDSYESTFNYDCYFSWGGYARDQPITHYSAASSVSSTGYIPLIDGTYYNTSATQLGAYTTWTGDYALNDWNGKTNSAVIKTNCLTNGGGSDDYTPMGILLNTFNAAGNSENLGETDWYIPSCGQLALIHTYTGRSSSYDGNVSKGINEMLTKIGGTTFDTSYFYWSSSQCSSNGGWRVAFDTGGVVYDSKLIQLRVRLVRDL